MLLESKLDLVSPSSETKLEHNKVDTAQTEQEVLSSVTATL